jgi:hypothetical protein
MAYIDWLALYALLSPMIMVSIYFLGKSSGYDECEQKMIDAKLREKGFRFDE